MFVDSHCHLDCIDLTDFDGSFDTLIQKTNDAGVEHMLCVGINLEKYPDMLALVADYPQISVSVGIHPMHDDLLDADYIKSLAGNPKVVAIGETGLDYYYHKGDNLIQQQRFRSHIQIANDMDKPVIVHTRDAGQDTLEILRSENAEKCSGVIHCFTETMEFAEKALELGFMISFSGITTFRNADALREVAKHVPDDCLLIETDAPYLAPAPHRGKQNWPGLVKHVAETLAEVRDTSVEEIAKISKENYYRLFGNN
ncbi:MAG: TatD family hydrolase [Gammaproteobacteria bacterium]|nr:TatD family hydrolase [Gammaproteobacteria bacterium]MCW8923245.1 TatD family hydrolase [Gammaproteobacteria bacterium]